MPRTPLPLLALAIVLSACACRAAGPVPTPPAVTAAAADTDAEVRVADTAEATTVTIRDPSGIGRARLLLSTPEAAGRLVLRLELAELERLDLAYGGARTMVSGRHGDPGCSQAVFAGGLGPGEAIEPSDPRWVDRRRAEGGFEIRLPAAVAASGAREVEVLWVDFLRE